MKYQTFVLVSVPQIIVNRFSHRATLTPLEINLRKCRLLARLKHNCNRSMRILDHSQRLWLEAWSCCSREKNRNWRWIPPTVSLQHVHGNIHKTFARNAEAGSNSLTLSNFYNFICFSDNIAQLLSLCLAVWIIYLNFLQYVSRSFCLSAIKQTVWIELRHKSMSTYFFCIHDLIETKKGFKLH